MVFDKSGGKATALEIIRKGLPLSEEQYQSVTAPFRWLKTVGAIVGFVLAVMFLLAALSSQVGVR